MCDFLFLLKFTLVENCKLFIQSVSNGPGERVPVRIWQLCLAREC